MIFIPGKKPAKKAKLRGLLSKEVLDSYFTKGGRIARKAKKFNAEVDALIAERKKRNNPNYGRPPRKGKLSPEALKKVSDRKVDKFGRNLYKYEKGATRAPKFPGIKGTPGRKLSPKALSKVSHKKVVNFGLTRKERKARDTRIAKGKIDIV